jgi:hypothetical protein
MKKFIKHSLLIIVILTACNDDFLEVVPLDRYSDATVWQDPALIESFVNNIYYGQKTGFTTVMLSSISDESMDVWSWNTQPVVNSLINSSDLGVLRPNHWCHSFDEFSWNSLYKNIRACNVFMKNIGESDLTGDDVDQLTGEVLFLRANFYFTLMSFFGGVPIIDQAFEPGDDFLAARNTLEETVDFIVTDCDAAANLLNPDGDKARATKGAALTLKSRVLLYAASDLFNSNGSWTSGYSNPELISFSGGDRTARWQAAQDAAKAVIDLNKYSLYGGLNPGSPEDAAENFTNLFLNHGNEEDIMLQYYDNINGKRWWTPSPGKFNGPNGYHNWGGNTPIGQFVDAFEMIDGSKFDWNNPEHAAAPYENRDPRFYASILYDGANWRERPDDVIANDPEGIVQTGYYENEDGTLSPGLDTRQSPIEDWNGTYSGYYMRKFIDPSINHQYEDQRLPWRQMRYAEVLLNYAEASIELGEEIEARKYLNMIRARAGMPEIAESETGEALMERYRNERRIELAYEQHRYFDIRRWMIAPQVINNAKGVEIIHKLDGTTEYSVIEVRDRAWNDNKSYLLPILLDEMNRNENLIQNPGY